LIFLAAALCFGSIVNAVADDQPASLTTNELAAVLGVHWWSLRLPDTAKPGSGIGIQWINADGSAVAGCSGAMTNSGITAGTVAKIFCKDDAGIPTVTVTTPAGDWTISFPAISMTGAALGGLPTGSAANGGDILLKLVHRAADGSLTVAPGNHLNPGDIGLRVTIRPPAN